MADGAASDETAELKRAGATLFAEGRVEDARVRFSEALRLAPKDLEARDGLVKCAVAQGHAALDGGEVDRAISHFQMALELSPFHPEADAGLRRAAALAEGRASREPLGAALESLPPVRALRDLQAADRVVGKVAGTPRPSQILKESLDSRRSGLAAQGAPPRERRIEHERAAAWRHRWFYRTLPPAVVAASALLWVLVGNAGLLNWGLLLGGFAALWDVAFVERGGPFARNPPST